MEVWTDGASSKDGRGGWAFVAVIGGDEVWHAAGGAHGTTNQRMELEAAIRALEFAPRDVDVTVVSDSAYLVNCFLQGWYVKWEANGWQKGGRGGDVANVDEWRRLLAAVRRRTARTSWRHVRGHQGHVWNERADVLAVAAKPDVSDVDSIAA